MGGIAVCIEHHVVHAAAGQNVVADDIIELRNVALAEITFNEAIVTLLHAAADLGLRLIDDACGRFIIVRTLDDFPVEAGNGG